MSYLKQQTRYVGDKRKEKLSFLCYNVRLHNSVLFVSSWHSIWGLNNGFKIGNNPNIIYLKKKLYIVQVQKNKCFTFLMSVISYKLHKCQKYLLIVRKSQKLNLSENSEFIIFCCIFSIWIRFFLTVCMHWIGSGSKIGLNEKLGKFYEI